jgi:hypothetical protein
MSCEACVVCLESLPAVPYVLPCKHSFHRTCIEAWETNHNTCPLCREPINLKTAPTLIIIEHEFLNEMEYIYEEPPMDFTELWDDPDSYSYADWHGDNNDDDC